MIFIHGTSKDKFTSLCIAWLLAQLVSWALLEPLGVLLLAMYWRWGKTVAKNEMGATDSRALRRRLPKLVIRKVRKADESKAAPRDAAPIMALGPVEAQSRAIIEL